MFLDSHNVICLINFVQFRFISRSFEFHCSCLSLFLCLDYRRLKSWRFRGYKILQYNWSKLKNVHSENSRGSNSIFGRSMISMPTLNLKCIKIGLYWYKTKLPWLFCVMIKYFRDWYDTEINKNQWYVNIPDFLDPSYFLLSVDLGKHDDDWKACRGDHLIFYSSA